MLRSLALALLMILATASHRALALEIRASAPRLDENDVLVLAPGRSTQWTPPPGLPVSVSNGSVIQVRSQGSRLMITGKKIGTAAIRSGSRSLEVRVVAEPAYLLHTRLSETLRDLRGLELKVDNGVPVIRGRLLRLDDWISLARAAGLETSSYRFEAAIEPDIADQALKHLRLVLNKAGLPELTLNLHPVAVVSLPPEPADLEARVMRALGPYGFTAEKNSTSLTLEPLVRVRMIVAELKTNKMTQFGIKWPSAVQGQLLPKFEIPTGEPPSIELQALEANGLGKVLASPTLLCRSGKEAEFLAGGEFPIKIANFATKDVIWKKYGVLLRVKPRADFSGRMSIAIETEVSMIDGAHTVDGVPGLFTNRIETHFDLSSSRTIALSGLLKKEWSENRSGLPGLQSLPILGPLFSSQDYREDRSELVVFVTPEVVRPDQEAI